VTEQNFRSHFPEKRAQFIVSDLLDKLPLQREYREAGRDLVSEKKSPLPPFTKGVTTLFLTNLPYIRSEDWIHMSADTVHEPRLALFGGELTGFEMYERLFAQIAELELTHFQLLCEFGFDQREIAESVLRGYPQWQASFFADYAGIERFAEVSL
jgi:methylase of polypeptide subunit release factors